MGEWIALYHWCTDELHLSAAEVRAVIEASIAAKAAENKPEEVL